MDVNPLLNKYSVLPEFSAIEPKHVAPAIEQSIEEYRKGVARILEENDTYTWSNLFEPLMDLDDAYHNVISPVYHLVAVRYCDELQEALDSTIELRTKFGSWLSHNKELYDAILQVAGTNQYALLTPSQKRVVDMTIESFERNGIDLPEEARDDLTKVSMQLSEAQSLFSKNMLKSTTEGWYFYTENRDDLDGLPPYTVSNAREEAIKRDKDGWVITLQAPVVSAVLTKSANRELRRQVYQAYVTTASDVGNDAGKWDNSSTVNQIVDLKTQCAQILGFDNHADMSLDVKMAKTPEKVFEFLHDLVDRTKERAVTEYEELAEFASQRGVDNLEFWDVAFYSELMRETQYAYSETELREYFTADNVVRQMFKVANALYGITFEEGRTTTNGVCNGGACRHEDYPVDVWDTTVKFYRVYDEDGEHIASFYLDLYARDNKRSGAWMDDCHSRREFPHSTTRLPVAYLNCNFNAPSGDIPSLLNMDEIETVFHEFGHGLHHMLTVVEYPEIAGISNVPWDAVELPSQFMEHFCWHKDSLKEMGVHYETEETIPDHLVNKVIKSKNFRGASALLRQLEFALVDMHVYATDDISDNHVQTTYRSVNGEVAVIPSAAYNRFYTSFNHIFAGGYSAGYYSYLWAEVMSSDVFGAFEEHGNIFSRALGLKFLDAILSKGGSEDFDILFENFRERQPEIDHLLRHRGII